MAQLEILEFPKENQGLRGGLPRLRQRRSLLRVVGWEMGSVRQRGSSLPLEYFKLEKLAGAAANEPNPTLLSSPKSAASLQLPSTQIVPHSSIPSLGESTPAERMTSASSIELFPR
ncbi:MAG: hypothetical protein IT427_04115 [Pirellulales bacterium]|nr:hypothetical protein [Pirellulales bacterium]